MCIETTVYLIDDDADVRDLVTNSLEEHGYQVSAFDCGKSFLNKVNRDNHGCVILDVAMPGISGLEIQTQLRDKGFEIPIIFMTGYADVPTSVSALKNGALDFLEKPFQIETLLERVEQAVLIDQDRHAEHTQNVEIKSRFKTLTKREVDVMANLVKGVANQSNKQVASDLGISHRTVEEYRSRILDKMNALSITHLVEMAKVCGIYQQ